MGFFFLLALLLAAAPAAATPHSFSTDFCPLEPPQKDAIPAPQLVAGLSANNELHRKLSENLALRNAVLLQEQGKDRFLTFRKELCAAKQARLNGMRETLASIEQEARQARRAAAALLPAKSFPNAEAECLDQLQRMEVDGSLEKLLTSLNEATLTSMVKERLARNPAAYARRPRIQPLCLEEEIALTSLEPELKFYRDYGAEAEKRLKEYLAGNEKLHRENMEQIKAAGLRKKEQGLLRQEAQKVWGYPSTGNPKFFQTELAGHVAAERDWAKQKAESLAKEVQELELAYQVCRQEKENDLFLSEVGAHHAKMIAEIKERCHTDDPARRLSFPACTEEAAKITYHRYHPCGRKIRKGKRRICVESLVAIPPNPAKAKSLCYTGWKLAMLGSGEVEGYVNGVHAVDAHRNGTLAKLGWRNILGQNGADGQPINEYNAPDGATLIYEGGASGHIETVTKNQYCSDYCKDIPISHPDYLGTARKLVGVYIP